MRAYSAVTVERNPLPGSLTTGADDVVGLHAVMAGNLDWGIALWEPYPDWRNHKHLALDLANPTEAPLLVQVHVRDQRQSHDRHRLRRLHRSTRDADNRAPEFYLARVNP